jgi:hypothetical protein
VFENRELRRILGPYRDEPRGDWRKLHNEELRNLYSLPNIINTIKRELGRACGMQGRDEKCIESFGTRAQGKKPLRRPRRRWEDNTKMYLKDIGWDIVDWIQLAQIGISGGHSRTEQ